MNKGLLSFWICLSIRCLIYLMSENCEKWQRWHPQMSCFVHNPKIFSLLEERNQEISSTSWNQRIFRVFFSQINQNDCLWKYFHRRYIVWVCVESAEHYSQETPFNWLDLWMGSEILCAHYFKSQHIIMNLSTSSMGKLQQLHFCFVHNPKICIQSTVIEEDRNQKISHSYQIRLLIN